MTRSKPRGPRPPLTDDSLRELALRYVGRFATTRAKLREYLRRKLRERGWDGSGEPDVAAVVTRFADLGYVDDAGFALAKSRALTARGLGERRVVQALRVAGVDEQDGEAARALASGQAVRAALRFAEKKKLGPFAAGASDARERDKALASMIRAGHAFDLARTILALPPGEPFDAEELSAR